MAAMNLPKKAEMASAKKRVHVSHETVIEDVSNSEGAVFSGSACLAL